MADRTDHYLRTAARLALRGHGGAEPNPLVGCVIVTPDERTVGWGYHRRCGGPHAEIEALRRAGSMARGATAYVTLEPCNHEGRTGPCSEALIRAEVAAVVMARADPHPPAAGGADRLRAAGVHVRLVETCREAALVSEPFHHRAATGLPWVIVKWAQTIDGRIATAEGESRWISGGRSRDLVHRERGRVDAVMTGIGTALADDPLLTARRVRRRRVARRLLVDPALQIPESAHLLDTSDAPTTVICAASGDPDMAARARSVEARGVEVVRVPAGDGDLPLAPALREVVTRHEIGTVLVEAGGGLVGRLFQEGLVNEAWVFTAPMLLGDERARSGVRGLRVERLADATRLQLIGAYRRGDDVLCRYLAGGRPAEITAPR